MNTTHEETNNSLPIFYYNCPSQFLKDTWQQKKKVNPSFSLRSWAKSLGFANNSPLSLMLKGERPIPKKYIPAFSKSLNLSAKESMYLETLVDYSREKDIEMKQYYLKRLESFSPKSELIERTEVDCFKYFSSPLHTFILEMSVLNGFQDDPKWIQKRLFWKTTLIEIKEALEVLKKLKLLKQDENGKWVRSIAHIHNAPDVQNLGAQKYHQNISKHAIQAVENQSVEEREFGSFTMNIKKENMEKAKEIIRKFEMEFIKEVESAPGQGEETYQLNVQFFKITK